MAEYNRILGMMQGLPFGSYTGELVAPINAQQQAGIGGINQYAGFAQPGISGAMGYAQAAAQPLTAQQIQQYMNPYTQNVVNSTMAAMGRQNQMGLEGVRGNAAAQNALGGNRVGVAEANYLSGQHASQMPLIAGLYQSGYDKSAAMAAQQFQDNPLRAANLYGNLALQGQTAGLQGAQAQLQAGTLQQQTQQALDTAKLQNWLLPYGQLGAQAQIAAGLGSQMGGTGTSETMGPAPNLFGQVAGLGVAALGAFSDERMKEDIHKVGETNDGQPIYRYRFKGSPKWEIGLLAQEVERDHPEAVTSGFGGMKMVDYKAATDDAVERWRGGSVAGFANGGMPSGIDTFSIPMTIGGVQMRPGDFRQNLRFIDPPKQSAGFGASDMKAAASGMKKIGEKVDDWWNGSATPLENYNPEQNTSHPNYAVGPELPEFYGTGAGTGIMPAAPSAWGFGGGGADFLSGFGGGASLFSHGGAVGYDEGGDVPTMSGFGASPVSFDDRFAASFDPASAPADVPLPPERPVAGFAPAPPSPPPIDTYSRAIAAMESSNNYSKVGPTTRTGDRAYGKYQVMGANVPEWTQAYYGKMLTVPEFMENKEAQEAVFKGRFGTYVDKYGPSGAARAWFAGERGMHDPNRRDILGTSVAGYERKFNNAIGAGGEPAPGMMALAAPDQPGPAERTFRSALPVSAPSAVPPAGSASEGDVDVPPNAEFTQGPTPGFGQPKSGWGGFNPFGLSEEARLGMIAAGLGMMASPSPYALSQVGEGGLTGLKAYTAARGQKRLEENSELARKKLEETERYHRTTAEQNRRRIDLQEQRLTDQAARGRWQFLGPKKDDPTKGYFMDSISGDVKLRDVDVGAKPSATATDAILSDETITSMAGQYLAGDKSVFQNLGRGAQGAANVVKIRNEINRLAKERGMTPDQIATKQADYAGRTAAMRSLGTRGVAVEYAANTALRAISLADEAMAKLSRTSFMPFNKLIELKDRNLLDVDQAAAYAAVNTLVNEYARVVTPIGVPTDSTRHHAREMLNTAMNHKAFTAVTAMMKREIAAAKAAYTDTRKEFLSDHTNEKPDQPQPKLNPEDQKALTWALDNRGDERAQKIFERLGVR